ncbi:MAG: hypothetical protein QW292_05750 [Candidatus Parvarchaeota archaeon]
MMEKSRESAMRRTKVYWRIGDGPIQWEWGTLASVARRIRETHKYTEWEVWIRR